MIHARHTPLTAFVVGMVGIALFSVMDAVMKGLVLAIGTYATLLWRSFVGVGIAGGLFAFNRPKWPSRATLKIHLTRGAVSTRDGRPVLLGAGARAAGAGDRAGVHRPAGRARALPR